MSLGDVELVMGILMTDIPAISGEPGSTMAGGVSQSRTCQYNAGRNICALQLTGLLPPSEGSGFPPHDKRKDSLMNFDTAWKEMKVRTDMIKNREQLSATVQIDFILGNATLFAPKFYREPGETRDVVKRAWETYCRGDDMLLSGITKIHLIDGQDASMAKAEQKIPA